MIEEYLPDKLAANAKAAAEIRLEADKGSDFLAPYLYEQDTSWVMRVNARRV